LVFAPLLRKDVVNVDILTEEDNVVELLAGPEIVRTFLLRKAKSYKSR